MDQQNDTANSSDNAGVLPMDTGVTSNGIHDKGGNGPSSNSTGKKGRGRPPKSAGSTKKSVDPNSPKRPRGRPAKTNESVPSEKTASVPVTKPKDSAASTNGDSSKKKRGRPSSKSSTLSEHTNGISKPQDQSTLVSNYVQEEKNDSNVPAKRKRGRPFGSVSKKSAVSSTSKESSSKKKRGRPSGSGGVKQAVLISKTSVQSNGSPKKRGRPKKATGSTISSSSTPSVPEIAKPATETTASVQ